MFTSFENPSVGSEKPKTEDISWSELLDADSQEKQASALRESLTEVDPDELVEAAIRDSGIPAEHTPLPTNTVSPQQPESYDFTN